MELAKGTGNAWKSVRLFLSIHKILENDLKPVAKLSEITENIKSKKNTLIVD
jgi:hypothetical protein